MHQAHNRQYMTKQKQNTRFDDDLNNNKSTQNAAALLALEGKIRMMKTQHVEIAGLLQQL